MADAHGAGAGGWTSGIGSNLGWAISSFPGLGKGERPPDSSSSRPAAAQAPPATAAAPTAVASSQQPAQPDSHASPSQPAEASASPCPHACALECNKGVACAGLHRAPRSDCMLQMMHSRRTVIALTQQRDSDMSQVSGQPQAVSCAWQMAGEMRMKMRASIRKSRKRGRGCLGSTPGRQQHRQRRRSPSRQWQSMWRRPKRTTAGPMMLQMMTSRGKTSVRHRPPHDRSASGC